MFRQVFYRLRTEGSGPGREAAAVGVGVFIGCLPFYGFHLLLCIIASTIFGLNRLKTYLAANISNPLVAPWLLFAEVQVGAWLRRGVFHELTLETVRTTGVRVFGADLLVGSVAIGAVLAGLAAWLTVAIVGSNRADPFVDLVRRASDRYAQTSITAWEFARAKLRRDPIYRGLIFDGLLATGGAGPQSGPADGGPRSGRTLVDIGCGQGLTLALLAEARDQVRSGSSPIAAGPLRGPAPRALEQPWPVFDRMVGIEMRPRIAALAAAALSRDAEIAAGDARSSAIEPADAILFLDVLHMMPRDEQEALLVAARASLLDDGVMVIREADAAAGWRFRMIVLGNSVKALVFGHWRQRFYFRSAADWESCLARLGMRAQAREMGHGTPFANVVFVVRDEPAVMPSSRRTDTSIAGVP